MKPVQFNFTPYWPVRNYESINEKYYQYKKCQCHHNLEQPGSCKGHYYQHGQQEDADDLIYQENYKYVGIGSSAGIENPARQLQGNEFSRVNDH